MIRVCLIHFSIRAGFVRLLGGLVYLGIYGLLSPTFSNATLLSDEFQVIDTRGRFNKEMCTLQVGPLFLQIHTNLNPLKVFTSSH